MRLLVSVRSAIEVEAALVGGADIVDAKEPDHGSLGAVTPGTLTEIASLVPPDRCLSVALGDLRSPVEVVDAIDSRPLPARAARVFLKLGFAGVRSASMVNRLLARAVAAAAKHPARAGIVAVAYADADRADTLEPERILSLAAESGAGGVLLDTHSKNGVTLVEWYGLDAVAAWVSRAREAHLLTALAGGLGLADLEAVRTAGPDVLGVRGAACEGGRHGRVTADRVRALRQRLPGLSSGTYSIAVTTQVPGVRETPEGGTIPSCWS